MKKIFVYGDTEKYRNYRDALSGCGALAAFSKEGFTTGDCDGLLLTGGADIDPAFYGQENHGSNGIDRGRDLLELELIRIFTESNRPILGICRGLQVLNVAFGGSLVQNIPTAAFHKWEESTGDKVHPVQTAESSFLIPLYGREFAVNSAHHQAVDSIAPGFSVSAKAADGVIEAIAAPEKKIFAVQWHPERMSFFNRRPDTVDGRHIFDYFLSLC